MPTKKTGNPPGRPKNVSKDHKGKKFDALQAHHRTANFDFAVHAVFDSGARYFVGSLSDPSHEALGSKFGGGMFELVKRETATKKLIGEPIILNVHPGLHKVKFTDPYAPTGPGTGPFGFLNGGGGGQQGQPQPQGGNEDRVLQALDAFKGDVEARLAESEDRREQDREEREREREKAEADRRYAELEAKLNAALAAPKSSSMDDAVKLVTLMQGLNPQPKQDLGGIVGALPGILGSLLTFGKHVVDAQPKTAVDAGDEALKMLMQTFGPVLARYTSGQPLPVNVTPAAAPAPAPAPAVGDNAVAFPSATDEQVLSMAVSQLTQRLHVALHGQQEDTPESVAAWVWSQSGPGWPMVHNFIRTAEATALVQAVLTNAPGLVQSEANHEGLLAIVSALKTLAPQPVPQG